MEQTIKIGVPLVGASGFGVYIVCFVIVCFLLVCAWAQIWQDGFKLRDYLKAESDIRLLGDKIAKMNTFLPAP